MAIIRSWSGDGLSAGPLTTASVGTGDTAFHSVDGSLLIEAAGPRSPRIRLPDAAGVKRVGWWPLGSNLTQIAARVYFLMGEFPVASTSIWSFLASGSDLWSLRINSSGRLYIRDDAAAQVVWTTTIDLPTDTMVRIESIVDNGDCSVKVFLGDTPTVILEVNSIAITSTAPDEWRIGTYNSAVTAGWRFEDIALSDEAVWIGSADFQPAPTGIHTEWSGDGLGPGPLTTETAGTGDTPPSVLFGASEFNVVTGGARSPQIRVIQNVGESAAVGWDFFDQSQGAFRVYVTVPENWDWPEAVPIISLVDRSLGASWAILRLDLASNSSPGKVNLRNESGEVDTTPSYTLLQGGRYRFEGIIDQSTGAVNVVLFQGDEDDPILTLGELTGTGGFGSNHSRILLGNTRPTVSAPTLRFDDLAVSNLSEYIGPADTSNPDLSVGEHTFWSGNDLPEGPFVLETSHGVGDTEATSLLGASTFTVDKTGPRPPQLMIEQSSGTHAAVGWDFPFQIKGAVRVYLTTPSVWSSGTHSVIALVRDRSTWVAARIDLGGTANAGRLRIRDSAGVYVVSTPWELLKTSTRYRIEILMDHETDTMTLRVYEGEHYLFLHEMEAVSPDFDNRHGRVYLGNVATTPTVSPIRFDDLVVSDRLEWIGAAAALPTRFRLLSTGVWQHLEPARLI